MEYEEYKEYGFSDQSAYDGLGVVRWIDHLRELNEQKVKEYEKQKQERGTN